MNNLTPAVKNLVQRFVPLPAVMTASTLNVVLMRMHEVDEGIDVVDKQGNVVGTSKLAAKKALKEMAVTRAALPIPLLTIVNFILFYFQLLELKFKNNLNLAADNYDLSREVKHKIFILKCYNFQYNFFLSILIGLPC